MKNKILDTFNFAEPSKESVIGVYRERKSGRREKYGIETNGVDFIRVYHDDVDGGSDFEFPTLMVRELFKKLKIEWAAEILKHNVF